MERWPYDLCDVVIPGYSLGISNNVRRSEFDDGAVIQRKTSSRTMKIREFNIRVRQSNLAAFRDWIEEHGHEFFEFRDWEGGPYQTASPYSQVRIRGGASEVEFSVVNGELIGSEHIFSASVTLEGY